jgi:hypothetical protein
LAEFEGGSGRQQGVLRARGGGKAEYDGEERSSQAPHELTFRRRLRYAKPLHDQCRVTSASATVVSAGFTFIFNLISSGAG